VPCSFYTIQGWLPPPISLQITLKPVLEESKLCMWVLYVQEGQETVGDYSIGYRVLLQRCRQFTETITTIRRHLHLTPLIPTGNRLKVPTWVILILSFSLFLCSYMELWFNFSWSKNWMDIYTYQSLKKMKFYEQNIKNFMNTQTLKIYHPAQTV
jgi:hypothetical protein